jgi:hypothetical protein
MDDSLPPSPPRDPSATDRVTVRNALDLFPREEPEPELPPADEITRSETATSRVPPSPPRSTAAPRPSLPPPVVQAAPQQPAAQTSTDRVIPLEPRRSRRSSLRALHNLERQSAAAWKKTVALTRRTVAAVYRYSRDVAKPALTRWYAMGRRGWQHGVTGAMDGATWSWRAAVEASTNLRRFVADRAWPACRQAAQPALTSIQKLAREPEVADHHTPALEPSRLALLSSTTLTIAFIAISMDSNVGRVDVRADPPPADSALPAGVAFSPSAAALESAPLATSEEPVRAGAAPSVVSEPPQVPQSALYRRMRSVNPASAVQDVLNQYRDGVSTLDPEAVKAVWPGVDELAMTTQFQSLFDHNLQFDACRISVSGSSATAICRGSTSSIFNARTRRRFTQAREWKFTLAEQGGRWFITSVVSGQPGGAETSTF